VLITNGIQRFAWRLPLRRNPTYTQHLHSFTSSDCYAYHCRSHGFCFVAEYLIFTSNDQKAVDSSFDQNCVLHVELDFAIHNSFDVLPRVYAVWGNVILYWCSLANNHCKFKNSQSLTWSLNWLHSSLNMRKFDRHSASDLITITHLHDTLNVCQLCISFVSIVSVETL